MKRRKKSRRVPVVRRTLSADGKDYLQTIIGSTKTGSQKLQFPYEIPTIKTEVALDKTTQNTLLGVAGGLALGMVGSAIIKRSKT